MPTSQAINNTYQILEEFKSSNIKRSFYSPPKLKFSSKCERSGKCKLFTEEEIFLFKLRMAKDRLNFE